MASISGINISEASKLGESTLQATTTISASLHNIGVFVGVCGVSYAIGRVIGSPKAIRDTIYLAALTSFFCRSLLLGPLWQFRAFLSEFYVYLIPLLVLNGLQVVYLFSLKPKSETPHGTEQASPLKPFIFPSSTSHARLFPRHHSFKYSYLLVGVPVGSPGSVGNLLFWDRQGQTSWWKDAWLSVYSENFLSYTRASLLEGRSQPPSLRQKLNAYLKSEGVDPALYAYAYLVTAPRVLGFSFNPVSFWYLYDKSIILRAMILEVNNTFGERRMYLLDRIHDGAEDRSSTVASEATGYREKPMKKFRSRWQKDFHVSPFNDREGEYSLEAVDPFEHTVSKTCESSDTCEANARIHNIITLSSPTYQTLNPDEPNNSEPVAPASSPKIIASITSTSSIDPTALSTFQQYYFLAQWAWTGFLTNPRILREARTLWSKGLKVWYRPEVYRTTIGREESGEEIIIERAFRKRLEECCGQIAKSGRTLQIKYAPAAGEKRGQTVLLGGKTEKQVQAQEQECLKINVLTPEFYSELARSPSLRDVWRTHCSEAKEGEAMVHCNYPKRLVGLIDEYISTACENAGPDVGEGYTSRFNDRLRQGQWLIIALFKALFSTSTTYSRRAKSPVTTVSFSNVTRQLLSPEEKQAFDHASLKILLADRLSIGFIGLLKLYGALLRMVGMWIVARELSYALLDETLSSATLKADAMLRAIKILIFLVGLNLVRRFFR